MIRRHTRSAIFIHWFNAVCWLFLLFSGFALLANEHMQPIGQWWVGLWQGMFGDRGLLVAHAAVGSVWVAVYAVYIIFFCRRDVLPFLRQITKFYPSDIPWCIKKGLWLVAGPKLTRKMGIDPALPPQGFYNAGQRGVAVVAVLASIALAVTGVIMAFFSGNAMSEAALQWCIFIHFCSAAIMAICLPIHIYMAALAPGEGPALRSMFTGYVPEEHVKHHNPLWYEELNKKQA
ncbi:MAG: cytochrome b/b6 domain-containing protein [Mailhella sp.]|nr:cytochrome b/b6 domain-containing protein [Mailhella sp.]